MKNIVITLLCVLYGLSTLHAQNGKIEMMTLPYATNALEPVISKQTVEFHYGKHLQNYVNALNELIKGTKFENSDLETIVSKSDGAIYQNAAQVLNHNLYFAQFSPTGGGKPTGSLAKAIEEQWGSFEKFQLQFEDAGKSIFGSGWAWLAATPNGKLKIFRASNTVNPLSEGYKPILGFDVWEHAYYLDYQNRRSDYLKALWSIIDWKVVESRYSF